MPLLQLTAKADRFNGCLFTETTTLGYLLRTLVLSTEINLVFTSDYLSDNSRCVSEFEENSICSLLKSQIKRIANRKDCKSCRKGLVPAAASRLTTRPVPKPG